VPKKEVAARCTNATKLNELRRLHLGHLVYCYKMVFGRVKLNFSDFF